MPTRRPYSWKKKYPSCSSSWTHLREAHHAAKASQAPVRSYTKDRAGLQGDHTPKGEDIRSRTEIPHVGTSAGRIGPRLWLTTACRSFVVERVPQGALQEGAQRYQAATTGLHKVPYCWAGIFVLEAARFLYPAQHFALIDNDCVPVTLPTAAVSISNQRWWPWGRSP